MKFLEYVDDDVFKSIVKLILDKGRKRRNDALKNFNKNVIDPFTSIFDSAVSEVSHKVWKQSEIVRQCQKTLTNNIGELHQSVLGNVDGWQDLGKGGGIDLVNKDLKIIAEVKNKFNTVTGGKLADQYNHLERLITPKASTYKGYKAYFVNIIPKKPNDYDIPFTPSDRDKGAKCHANENIRLIDGASFYSLVTGRKNALHELFNALILVIEEIYKTDYSYKNFKISDKSDFEKYFNEAYISETK